MINQGSLVSLYLAPRKFNSRCKGNGIGKENEGKILGMRETMKGSRERKSEVRNGEKCAIGEIEAWSASRLGIILAPCGVIRVRDLSPF